MLRRITDVIRQGRVRAIEAGGLRLEAGFVPVAAGALYVDCTASAVTRRPAVPVFDGDRITLAVSQGRYSPLARLSVEPTVSVNRVRLPAGHFTTTLLGSRVTYTITPWAFLSTLVQYNSGTRTVSTNARFRWEYRPGREFFAVYNEQRDTLGLGAPDLQNRAFIVKVNRSMRF